MKRFKDFMNESHLHVFDIDDTLFQHHAKIKVLKGKKQVGELSSAEYAKHTLPTGHKYDFSQFRSAQHFHDTSTPIEPMINKLKALHKNPRNKIIMNTARQDLDDRETFLNTFRKNGIDIDRIHIHRAGNLAHDTGMTGHDAKAEITHRQIEKGKYNTVHMYDDHKENLNSFMALKDRHPHIQFKAYHVNNGKVKRHKP